MNPVTPSTLDDVPVKLMQPLIRRIDGEAVLAMPATAEVKVLNESADAVFALIDGHRSIRDIAGVLSAAYGIAATDAESDTLEFVDALQRRQMVRLERRADQR